MMTRLLFLTGWLLAVPAVAQVTVSPGTVEATLAEGATATVVLTVSNAADSSGFALSLAPAQKEDDPPEPPGTVLFTSENICCGFGDITSTPDGQFFVEVTSGGRDTYEFTPELAFVREFDTPLLENLSAMVGVAYDADNGTLWWTDVRSEDGITLRAFLTEGTLDGEATGRTLPARWDTDDGLCGRTSGRPSALTYDAVSTAETTGGTGYFYHLDLFNDTVWATDTDGEAVDGYPYRLTDYAGIPQPEPNEDGCVLGFGIDAHALGGELVLESLAGYPFVHPQNRPYTVVVTDREGRNRGAETPLFDLPTPDGFGDVLKLTGVTRSRLDPSVLYVTVVTGLFGNFRDWVYAVRSVPLPPVWLRGAPILFGVDSASETEVTLTLDASGLEPGVYEAVVSVREGDGIGPVLVEVPVTLSVTPVSAEDEIAEPGPFVLGEPYPNPATESVTVPLRLGAATEVQVSVFDILGREMVAFHSGPLPAGAHRFPLDTASLPAGVYLVRATAGAEHATTQVAVVR